MKGRRQHGLLDRLYMMVDVWYVPRFSRNSQSHMLLWLRQPDHVSSVHPDPGWFRLIPVGLMWGNDPGLTQVAFDENGDRPMEHWINPAANELLWQLRGGRPAWGWNGRMNGYACKLGII